jgi:hypothetical protein
LQSAELTLPVCWNFVDNKQEAKETGLNSRKKSDDKKGKE